MSYAKMFKRTMNFKKNKIRYPKCGCTYDISKTSAPSAPVEIITGGFLDETNKHPLKDEIAAYIAKKTCQSTDNVFMLSEKPTNPFSTSEATYKDKNIYFRRFSAVSGCPASVGYFIED